MLPRAFCTWFSHCVHKHFWIRDTLGATDTLSLSLSVFLSSSFVNCEIQNLRTSYLGTWPPSFYETFDKRLRAKFPGSFVTRLLQHSDFRPLFLACLRFSCATLPQSSSNLHCSSGWIRFDVLLLRRNVYVIDCMIETKFISGLY